MNTADLHEYKNDFLYFMIGPDKNMGKDSMFYCSGVDLHRFLPITKGRHRPMSNPAMRGLQLVNLGVRALAISNGATPKAVREDCCAGIVPVRDGLYKERLLLENAPESLPDEIINYCVVELLNKIANACLFEDKMPAELMPPYELQEYIETLCSKYGNWKT